MAWMRMRCTPGRSWRAVSKRSNSSKTISPFLLAHGTSTRRSLPSSVLQAPERSRHRRAARELVELVDVFGKFAVGPRGRDSGQQQSAHHRAGENSGYGTQHIATPSRRFFGPEGEPMLVIVTKTA